MPNLALLWQTKGDELESLRRAIHEPRSTVLPLVGSGLSLPPELRDVPATAPNGRRLRLPTWKEMLAELGLRIPKTDLVAQREFEECLGRGDLLQAADIVEARAEGGARLISEYIARVFRDPPGARPQVYDALARWPVDQFLTTNFDPWLEQALKRRRPQLDVKDPADVGAYSELRASGAPFLFHLHGRAARPERCVLTHASYRRLVHAHPMHQRMLESFVAHRQIVYLGYSLSDPDPTLALESWFSQLPEGTERRHYFLDAHIPEHRARELGELGVTAIDYGDHAVLPELIAWLGRAIPAESNSGPASAPTAIEPHPLASPAAPANSISNGWSMASIGLAGLLVVAAVVLVPSWLGRNGTSTSTATAAIDLRIEALARELPASVDRALDGDQAFITHCRSVSDAVAKHFSDRASANDAPLALADAPGLAGDSGLDMAQLKLREEQLYRSSQDDPELRERWRVTQTVVGVLSARRAARDRVRDAAFARAERVRDWLAAHSERAERLFDDFERDVEARTTPYERAPARRYDLVPLAWSRERPAVFWVLGTGAEPTWDASEQSFELHSEGAGVLVALLPPLVPGSSEAPVFVGATEFTFGQWSVLFSTLDTREVVPARAVDWYRALEACVVLGGWLPSIEQWNRACLAGGAGPYSFEDPERVRDYAWFDGDQLQLPQPVATKRPNSWGLYDTCGNVSEWSAESSPDQDGRPFAFLRGGSFTSVRLESLSVLERLSAPRSAHNDNTGFRFAIER